MRDLREMAVAILGERKLRMLEEAGITVAPKMIMEQLQDCQQENILMFPKSIPVLIAPATSADIERVNRGYVVMD